MFSKLFLTLAVLLLVAQAAVINPIEAREKSNCPSRRFVIDAQGTFGSLLGSITYQAIIRDDSKKKSYIEITTCTAPGILNRGAGCKWTYPGTARISKEGKWWDVTHTGYRPAQKNTDSVTVRGGGCTHKQKCKSGTSQICEPDPISGAVNCVLMSATNCRQ